MFEAVPGRIRSLYQLKKDDPDTFKRVYESIWWERYLGELTAEQFDELADWMKDRRG
jgi:protoheme ferro-lyase